MIRHIASLGIALLVLTACEEIPTEQAPASKTTTAAKPTKSPSGRLTDRQAARAFIEVTNRVEPIAERECRRRTSNVNCDFRIIVDDRPNQPPNAYQTLDDNNRPIIAFTLGLITRARNADELAFVMGHEAAHHIQGHIMRQQQNALRGAVLAGGVATLIGGSSTAVREATEAGAQIGARTYSKTFELEADELGTILTLQAGYDALRGAEFFARIPDPGDRFLGTHPPNAKRVEIVHQTVAKYKKQ
ncbi:MAG: M48 family metallopeptidase [Aliishimia sp.]